MISDYAEWLGPESKWYEGLKSGALRINEGANRVIDAHTKRFVAKLVPGSGLQQQLTQLPLDPGELAKTISQSSRLSVLEPMLKATQLLSGVGAVASVANLGVSCVGFALVLSRLSRIDGKLDECIGKLQVLQKSVERIHGHQQALSLARLHSAGESLERSLSASSATTRRELASRARDLFQESKFLYLELWRQSDPWPTPDIPVPTALELQGRIVASALGELQAEFVVGDLGAFRQAVNSAATLIQDELSFKAPEALTKRSDSAARNGFERLAQISVELPLLAGQLKLAAAATRANASNIAGFEGDAEAVEAWGIEPYEYAQIVRAAHGDQLYMIAKSG